MSWFMVLCLFFLVLVAAADAITSPSCEAWQARNVVYYNTGNFNPGSPVEANQAQLFDYLISAANSAAPSSTGVRSVAGSRGRSPNTVYGYAECYGPCGNCLVEARNRIKNSVPIFSLGARLCTDQCSLRFETYPFP